MKYLPIEFKEYFGLYSEEEKKFSAALLERMKNAKMGVAAVQKGIKDRNSQNAEESREQLGRTAQELEYLDTDAKYSWLDRVKSMSLEEVRFVQKYINDKDQTVDDQDRDAKVQGDDIFSGLYRLIEEDDKIIDRFQIQDKFRHQFISALSQREKLLLGEQEVSVEQRNNEERDSVEQDFKADILGSPISYISVFVKSQADLKELLGGSYENFAAEFKSNLINALNGMKKEDFKSNARLIIGDLKALVAQDKEFGENLKAMLQKKQGIVHEKDKSSITISPASSTDSEPSSSPVSTSTLTAGSLNRVASSLSGVAAQDSRETASQSLQKRALKTMACQSRSRTPPGSSNPFS